MIHKTEVDTIIDEIHRTRERLAKKFGGDIKAILEDARRRQAASGRTIWHGSVANKVLTPKLPDEK
ncbi:MAG: hypothetical protein ACKVT0_06120 [Planctomycetaceae bacterium]